MQINIVWLDSIDSTNSEAFRKMDVSEEGRVWAARFQTAGRGQKGNSWESAVGQNLTFSVLLKPEFLPAERQFLVSEVAALAVCDLLRDWGLEASIKWPNDIYIGDKKIQGMLIEHFLSGMALAASIVGIGVNLNQERFASDAPNPTSVYVETGKKQDVDAALELFMRHLQGWYARLRAGEEEAIEAAYCEKLYRRDIWAPYIRGADQTPFEGKILGIDKYGCLRVALRDGTEECFAFKEIQYVIKHL